MKASKTTAQLAWVYFVFYLRLLKKLKLIMLKALKASLCVVHIANAAVFGIGLYKVSDYST